MPELDEAVRRLVELGLTLTEARCYVALLHIAPATAGELGEASGVPRPKVYGTLKSLEQRSFCYPSGDRVITYRPVDPELALGEWTRAREHDRRLVAERDRRLSSELISMLPDPPDPTAESKGDVIMELTGGPEATMERVERIFEGSERRLDIVNARPVVQKRERWNRLEIAALERGVQVRILFVGRELAVDHRYEEIVAAGGEVRLARDNPLKVVVRDDGAEAAVALRSAGEEHPSTYLVITHHDLVAPLQLLFNREWRRGFPMTAD